MTEYSDCIIRSPDNQGWFFIIHPDGTAEWNPEIIKAFVRQLKEELEKEKKETL